MAIQRQAIPINFSGGLDTKTDPLQISIGSFLSLTNSVFTKGKRLTKRNGFGKLSSLPNPASFLTTFNGDLTAVGSDIQAYSTSNNDWVSKGKIEPITLSTLPIIRNNLNQTQSDSVVSSNGLVCTSYTEINASTKTYKYVVADSVTGQNIVEPTVISGADATYGTPKSYLLGGYFIVVYSTSSTHLSYIAIPIMNPGNQLGPYTISTDYSASTHVAFDGFEFNNQLFLAWNGNGTGIQMAYIGSTMPGSTSPVSAAVTIDGAHQASIMSVTADIVNSVIYVSYVTTGTPARTCGVNTVLQTLPGFPTQITGGINVSNLASIAGSGKATVYAEITDTYFGGTPNNHINNILVRQDGTTGPEDVGVLGVGLASKAFVVDGHPYFLATYQSEFQNTYFLMDGHSTPNGADPIVLAKLAYENGGGYLHTGLPNVSVYGEKFYISYLIKDLVQAITNANSSGTLVNSPVYSQTGINMVTFELGSQGLYTSEIGSNLNITGGFLWMYDGYLPVENGFFLWPDHFTAVGDATSGSMSAQQYFYMVTYEWTDNQGNAFRSAPSIPVTVTLTSNTSVLLTIPTLRLTYKVANPIKIVIYRWSVAQQTFHQVTSITSPILNSVATDTVSYIDTLADASIAGNNIIYTTGGVIENISPPATSITTLFDDRLWLVDAEDPNLLWFSKQVIEATPVEMSDLLTMYVAPSVGATGPTGPITAISAMDDKLIIFKQNAIYYVNGNGPDNTGASNQYSQPIIVTAMVGCSNVKSIVFQPNGLMFEFSSEAGSQIWLLGRDLSTQYIGSPVEDLTFQGSVLSSIAVPGTNQVRFNLSSGITLMWDYFFMQWGTFSSNSESSTLFQDLHTYVSPSGDVFQETPGKYMDGAAPVLLSFTTGHIQLSGISGYQRIWEIQLLGQYVSPHLLQFQIGYDYRPLSEQALITPINFTEDYGGDSLYGQTSPFGGPGSLEQWRIQPATQKCQSFQISLTEVYDPSYGVSPGAGFTLSAMTCVIGVQRGYRPVKAATTAGTS